MTRTAKGKPLAARSLRLDDEVWEALQTLKDAEGSVNEGLRTALFQSPPRLVPQSSVPKLSKADQRVAEVAASDVLARAVDRRDVDYDDPPTQHIINIPVVAVPAKLDINNLPETKPIGMTRNEWEMLQRKKNPPPTPDWRKETVPLSKSQHKS